MARMTAKEREELTRLVRQREKVMKSQARQRTAELLAEFEAQCAAIHRFDNDEVWAQAKAEAEKAVMDAQEQIRKRCAHLNIPEEFQPTLQVGWFGRGHGAVRERQEELRRLAKRKIEAMEAEAVARIEHIALDANTQIVNAGLETEDAQAFVKGLTKIETLMPQVDGAAVQAMIESVSERRAEQARRMLQ